jgi:tRNA-Thr(GGU) m(6)t(6)A37 methyltransferase TsaA
MSSSGPSSGQPVGQSSAARLRGEVTLADGSVVPLDRALSQQQLQQLIGSPPTAAAVAAVDPAAKLLALNRACKAELSTLHKQMNALQRTVARDLEATRRDALAAAGAAKAATDPSGLAVTPVGCIESCFAERNGTPRQPGLAPAARSRLRVAWGTHPAHTLAGLEGFSHVWLLFVFDRNRGGLDYTKSKVRPPRLDGAPTGVFGCRTPHRPNAIGLSLVQIERIEGGTLHLLGADLIDGTPVLDIKPYLPYAFAQTYSN